MRLDDLVFGENERGPGEDLALQFEAVKQFSADERQTVREPLEGMLLKHEARRWGCVAGGGGRGQGAGGQRQAAGACGMTIASFLAAKN